MKLSELKLGQKAKIQATKYNYSFTGTVELRIDCEKQQKLYLWNNKAGGYEISEKFDHLYDVVELVN